MFKLRKEISHFGYQRLCTLKGRVNGRAVFIAAGKSLRLLISLAFLIGIVSCQPEWVKKGPSYDYEGMDEQSVELHKNIRAFLYELQSTADPVYIPAQAKIKSVIVDETSRYFEVEFTKPFSYIPFREETVEKFNTKLTEFLNYPFNSYRFSLRCLGVPIKELIPNYYRTDYAQIDKSRIMPGGRPPGAPVVRRSDMPVYERGLSGMNIAVWPSHGWYYNHQAGRWEWQRPRLFQTVEDLLSVSFVAPYLIPMLENAGANVYTPRERDFQINEVVVDNDNLNNGHIYKRWSADTLHRWQHGGIGFRDRMEPLKDGENPFEFGTYEFTASDTVPTAIVEWNPEIPESGKYAVYVSYNSRENSSQDACYTVHHQGGQTSFLVNQQKGGGTWIYLGTFKFKKGRRRESGKVELSNHCGCAGQIISADAVRFGGGMGSVERGGFTSNRPRFVEAARYWLQYAGYPDSLVYKMAGDSNDYVDDYKSRPEFTNFLSGSPLGPTKNRAARGLGIPIDLSLAVHTDAGVSPDKDRVGTMVIYSLFDPDSQKVFPDGISRLANRDLADILQTQIIADIRNKYDVDWPRRILKEAWYSEAARPNRPSVLLELLSHQNFRDAQLAAEPRFRFDICRSVYKAMVKFLSVQYQKSYTIQPLPVKYLTAEIASDKIIINWQPQTDPFEPTANAHSYWVYVRQDSGGFDNGRRVKSNRFVFRNPKKDVIYSFMIRAENEGGLSMPSEFIPACIRRDSKGTILVVNGFDRISGPQIFDFERYQGFFSHLDQGVPDRYDINFTGTQFEFDKTSFLKNNDAPGHGASYADFETSILPGNTFDFAFVHGNAIYNAGWSFTSCSDEAVETGFVNLNDYEIIDWILGEEKETPGPDSIYIKTRVETFKTLSIDLQEKISAYLLSGGGLFISGAYIGTDLNQHKLPTERDVRFSRQSLKMNWVTNHAARNGLVWCSDSLLWPIKESFVFNTDYHPHIYTVEAPDALSPLGGAKTILRYSENNFSAAIGFSGKYSLVVCGFPFETIVSQEQRNRFMEAVLRYLTLK